MTNMAFWESTFYFGIAVTVFLVVSPFIVFLASKNEKNRLHRILYVLIAFITDCGLIGWFLIHIHSHGLTLPELIRCYVDYFRHNPL